MLCVFAIHNIMVAKHQDELMGMYIAYHNRCNALHLSNWFTQKQYAIHFDLI